MNHRIHKRSVITVKVAFETRGPVDEPYLNLHEENVLGMTLRAGSMPGEARSMPRGPASLPDRLNLLVLIPYDLCRPLTDDHTGSHGIAGCHAWHDRSIRNAKVLDPVNFEITIHHRHFVSPHFGGGCLMPKAKRCVSDVVF